eukprot:gene8907-17417_t
MWSPPPNAAARLSPDAQSPPQLSAAPSGGARARLSPGTRAAGVSQMWRHDVPCSRARVDVPPPASARPRADAGARGRCGGSSVGGCSGGGSLHAPLSGILGRRSGSAASRDSASRERRAN